ncbi:MAG TPA: hypothetical protein VK348_06750, partial [Planctomycetota bacterium]|nr:hypothetical protein [Planctomycetota bacterium]
SVPVVEIPAGPYTLTNATIGNLTQFAGAAAVTIQNASVDQCHFLGSAIVGAPASLLAAANAVEIRCTTPVTTPPTTITIGGLWTSDSSWQPASGKVLFTGPIGPSAIIAPNTHWFDLEIDAAFGLALTGDLVVDNALRMRSDVTMSGTTIDLGARAGLTFGADLNANNVTTLRIRNGLISAGSIHAPHATMTAAGDITLFITGVLDLGGGTHTVSDTFNVAGVVTMPPAGTLVFTGAGNITVSAFSLLPNVRITGTNYTILDGTITNLTHDVGAGNLNILRCTVQGQCSFRGASVQDFNHGTLTAGGPLLWQTATVVSNPPSMITSSGSWTSDASFAPAAGLVVFNGAGAQAVSVPAFHWHDLRIAAGTSVSTPLAVTIDGLLDVQGTLNAGGNAVSVAGPLTVAGSLQDNSATSLQAHGGLNVAGTLQATAAAIDVNGDAVVPGTLAIGPGGHLFSNSLTVTGTMTVPPNQLVTFDGSGVINVVLSSPLRSVQFTGTAYDVQSLKVTQDLTQSAGTLRIQRCDVGGHAILQGSQVLDLNTGLLSVTGDLDWLTSSAVTAPPATIQCGGNWSANSAFAPASGLVELNGNGPQAVTMISFLWFNLRIGPNSTVNTGQDATTHGFLDLLGHLSCGGSSVHVDGALTIAAGGALNAGAAINLVLGANASIAGTLAMAAAVIDAHRDLSVAATGAVVLGNGTHLLRGGLSQLGSLTLPAGSQVQFLGDGDVQAIAGQPLPRVTFAGGIYNVIDLTVAGALLQTSGRLLITNLHALSTATFQGTSIANNGPSQLQVDGNLALQTANAVTSPPDTIICGGTWTSNSQFLPVSGTIVMNGAGAQSMTAPVLSLSSLTVVPTSVVSFSTSDVILQANLTVNGRVNAPTGGLEIRGNLSVGNGGILQLAAGGTCTVAGSCTNAGSITGPTVLDLVGTGTLSGAGAFPQVDVRGIGEVSVSGNVLFGQSLTVTGGTLRLLGGSNLHVLGNLVGTAGALRGTVGGVLMVDGNVTLSGTVAHATGVPTIHCAGNWLALGTFAPTSGTVFLDGPGTLGTLGGAIHFAALDIGSAVRQLVGNLGVTAQTMHVQAGGELRVASTHLDLTATTATIDGTLALSAGGRLFLGAATALTVTATGAARLVGTFAAPVV